MRQRDEFDGNKLKPITKLSLGDLRFHTSKSGDEQISLKEFARIMPEDQNDIYYATEESITAASTPPFSDFLRKKGVEVLYLADPYDEYAVLGQQLKETHGKKLTPILT